MNDTRYISSTVADDIHVEVYCVDTSRGDDWISDFSEIIRFSWTIIYQYTASRVEVYNIQLLEKNWYNLLK